MSDDQSRKPSDVEEELTVFVSATSKNGVEYPAHRDHDWWTKRTMRALATIFGGATAFDCHLGAWRNPGTNEIRWDKPRQVECSVTAEVSTPDRWLKFERFMWYMLYAGDHHEVGWRRPDRYRKISQTSEVPQHAARLMRRLKANASREID